MLEHSAAVAKTALELGALLCTIVGYWHLKGLGPRVAIAALYHDDAEAISGDIPGDYKSRLGLDAVDAAAAQFTNRSMPDEIRPLFQSIVAGKSLDQLEHSLLKYADLMAAYAYCVAEKNMGNLYAAETLPPIAASMFAILEAEPVLWELYLHHPSIFPNSKLAEVPAVA